MSRCISSRLACSATNNEPTLSLPIGEAQQSRHYPNTQEDGSVSRAASSGVAPGVHPPSRWRARLIFVAGPQCLAATQHIPVVPFWIDNVWHFVASGLAGDCQ